MDWDKEEETSKAVKCELKQLFHKEFNALLPVKTLSVSEVALGSHMFVTVKHIATGAYDKTKARLVADGSQQDASLYPDKSSPTLAMHSLYTVFAMYAGLSGFLMAKVDIKGAFVQTPMEGPNVYMHIHRKVVAYLLVLYPEFAEYVQADGSIITLLLNAMYGCVQASKLWYIT